MIDILRFLNNNCFFYTVIFLLALIKGFYFSHFGLNIYDYGETLDNATKILDGGIPYKDIWTFFPPGFSYFPAIILAIFGKSLLVVRYVESVFFAVLVLIMVLIAGKFITKFLLFLLSLTLIFSDLNTYLFFYYVFFFGAIFLAIEYLKSKSNHLIFLSGLLMGVGSLFRHDTTLISLIAIGVTLLVAFRYKVIDHFRSAIFFLGLGCFGVVTLSLLVISRTWSILEFLYMAFIRAPQISRGISFGIDLGKISLSNITEDQALHLFTVFFYLIYIMIYILTGAYLLKGLRSVKKITGTTVISIKEKIIILCLFFFGLLQIPHAFSVIEMGHLVKAGVVAFILGFYLLQKGLENKRSSLFKATIISPVVIFLLGNLLISYWWIHLNDTEVQFDSGAVYLNSRAIVGTTYASVDTIKKSVSFIRENTQKNDYVFTAPYQAILYFLADRKNPTKFNNFVAGVISPENETEIIDSLQEKNVRIIVYDPENAPFKKSARIYIPKLHRYMISNFDIVEKTNEGWLLMRRKNENP